MFKPSSHCYTFIKSASKSLMFQENNYHKENKEQLDSKKEVDSAEKTGEKIYTSLKQGNPMS
jgi:hypothetical protein